MKMTLEVLTPQQRANAAYHAATQLTDPTLRALCILKGHLESVINEPASALVYLYVGQGEPEPGTIRLGDLRTLVCGVAVGHRHEKRRA